MIREEQLSVPRRGFEAIPCSMWSDGDEPAFVVLMGHGLGVDRYHDSVRYPMQILTGDHQAAVIAPDIPLHGVRSELPDEPMEIVRRWQTYWASGGAETVCLELLTLLRFAVERYPSVPIAYFGLSLGTQYGVVFLSRADGISAAVLGLFGSEPPPKTPVMNRCAPDVTCPVYFVQKLEDEIHPATTTAHLFDSLGAEDKVLDASRGGHVEVSADSFRAACAFLAAHASGRP